MGTNLGGVSNISGERSNVGALGAVDVKVHNWARPFGDVEPMNRDFCLAEHDFFSFSGGDVCLLSVHLFCAVQGGHLLNFSCEVCRGILEVFDGQTAWVSGGPEFGFEIVAVGH